MKIYAMENGHIRIPLMPNAPDGTGKTISMPIPSYLIEHEEGYVLIDCGLSKYEPRAADGGFGSSETPSEEQTGCLRDLGVAPEDIKYVILSHLHADHCGYLASYKNAEIYIHEGEYRDIIESYKPGCLSRGYFDQDIEAFRSSGLNFKPVSGVCELRPFLPGIDIIVLGPGHASGMLGVMLHTRDHGNVIIAQDAADSRRSWGPPVILPGIMKSKEGFLRSVEYLRKLCDEYSATLIFGHDPEQFAKLKKHRDGYYE